MPSSTRVTSGLLLGGSPTRKCTLHPGSGAGQLTCRCHFWAFLVLSRWMIVSSMSGAKRSISAFFNLLRCDDNYRILFLSFLILCYGFLSSCWKCVSTAFSSCFDDACYRCYRLLLMYLYGAIGTSRIYSCFLRLEFIC